MKNKAENLVGNVEGTGTWSQDEHLVIGVDWILVCLQLTEHGNQDGSIWQGLAIDLCDTTLDLTEG